MTPKQTSFSLYTECLRLPNLEGYIHTQYVALFLFPHILCNRDQSQSLFSYSKFCLLTKHIAIQSEIPCITMKKAKLGKWKQCKLKLETEN